MNPFPTVLFQLGPLAVTDTIAASVVLSLLLVVVGRLLVVLPRARASAEVIYDFLETAVKDLSTADVTRLVPLVLTLWLFLGASALVGIVPGVMSPTRDLSLAAALATVSFLAGHLYALREQGFSYLRSYVEPSPLLLPFNVIGEITRTIALALRLFGNMLSGSLIGAIAVYLAGLFVPIPLMLLGLLSGLVQAYIFGVLTLVFAVSALATASRPRKEGAERQGETR